MNNEFNDFHHFREFDDFDEIRNAKTPVFNGRAIFGADANFTFTDLAQRRALDVDIFLGLTPGTTAYGADPSGGRIFGITGALVATSADAVTALAATLLSLAGPVCSFGMPTGLPFPGNYYFWGACYFVAAEFIPAPAGAISIGGGMWSLSYSMVIRHVPGS
jgi:hypothetical protein